MIRGLGDEMILDLFSNFKWVRSRSFSTLKFDIRINELQVGHFW